MDANYCKQVNSKVLAAHIVVYRSLHLNQELAKLCMQELLIRKSAGDNFDFEAYIEEKLATIPKPIDPEKKALLDRILSNSELRNARKTDA
jgi:hypothetical protein